MQICFRLMVNRSTRQNYTITGNLKIGKIHFCYACTMFGSLPENYKMSKISLN